MLNQSIQDLLPLLSMLQQPAFCISDTGVLHSNSAARHLAPLKAEQLSRWLGDGSFAYTSWNRLSVLELPVLIHSRSFMVSIQALQDGPLFLLTEQTAADTANEALAVASQVLRQPLTDLSVLLQQLSATDDPASNADTVAAMTRQIYRLSRMSSNLSDLTRLHNGTYQMHTEVKELSAALTPFLEELEALCSDTGRHFLWKLPGKPMMLQADYALLERAILNLLSNAIKFGSKSEPITFWIEDHPPFLLLRLRNQCSGSHAELLRAAFIRLEQRNQIPDPRWGIGLGLPIAQYIARLHGGMVAVEANADNQVTVTFSLSRKRPMHPPVLTASSVPFEYTGGMRRSLMELSDVLPNQLFRTSAI